MYSLLHYFSNECCSFTYFAWHLSFSAAVFLSATKEVISPTAGHWTYYILCVLPLLTQTRQQGYFIWMWVPLQVVVQVFYEWDEDMTAAGNEKALTLIVLTIILFIHYTGKDTFLKEYRFFSLVLEYKHDCSLHKSTLPCFCYMWSVHSLGFVCHFLSPMVFVDSLVIGSPWLVSPGACFI